MLDMILIGYNPQTTVKLGLSRSHISGLPWVDWGQCYELIFINAHRDVRAYYVVIQDGNRFHYRDIVQDSLEYRNYQ